MPAVGLPVFPPAQIYSFVSEGVRYKTIREVIDLSAAAAANFPLLGKIPAGSVVVAAAMSIPNTIQAATATKIGLGRSTTTANPSKYLLSAALTAAELKAPINQWSAPLAAEEALYVAACDNAGAAAGTIGGGADDYVIVSITYFQALGIYDQ
jgi:hypothetical protein